MTGPTVRPGMEQDDGRVPDGTGLSSPTEPQEGLGPTGFDPSRVAHELSGISGLFSRLALVRAVSPLHLHHTPGYVFGAVDDALRSDPLCQRVGVDKWWRDSDGDGDGQ
jgi:hypothetical protein